MEDMAKKKESIWAQTTLSGKRSMDWMKNGSTVEALQIELGREENFSDEYEMPEWLVASGKDVMIIYDVNGNKSPLLVTSQPVIRHIVDFIIEAEKNGAKSTIQNNRLTVKLSEKNAPRWKFTRDEKAGKYAPYTVENWEVV